MGLNLDKIPQKIKQSDKKDVISRAIKNEQRLRFHTEGDMTAARVGYLNEFLSWVSALLPKDKYDTFVKLFRFPNPMVSLTTEIYRELEKVFDGKDANIQYQFTDRELNEDWDNYRETVLNEPRVWRELGWDIMKTAVNSIVVVDLPTEQTTDQPEPYFYFVGIENVINYKVDKQNKFEWVIFSIGSDRIAIYDDDTYRTFKKLKDGEYELEIENPHDLGYCPITWFWNTPIKLKDPDVKSNPIMTQLSAMDWSLFFGTSKKHLDLYAAYPIYSTFEANCDFENDANGSYCDGGFLRGEDSKYILDRNGNPEHCPVCSNKRLVGAGSQLEVPIPDEGVDLRDPVTITTVDKDSLSYNVEENERLVSHIFKSVVGDGSGVVNTEAVNEKQVTSAYQSKTAVLNNIKTNFEKVMAFADDTCCRLRYGGNYLGSSFNLGTEFYIYSVDDLHNQYKTAKENGADESELDSIAMQIIQTEYRNNPRQMQRMELLRELEPLNNMTRIEAITMLEKGIASRSDLRVKFNFNSFVSRFERENTDILEFGSNITRDQKLKVITNKFKDYAKEIEEPEPANSGNE